MYWDVILYEVRNKHSPHCFFAFTSLGGDEDEMSSERRRVRRGKGVEALPRKNYVLGPGTHFTQREAECIVKLLNGKCNNEVAREMELSKRTIEFYIKNMKSKLHCHTRQELISKVSTVQSVWQWDVMSVEAMAS